MPSVMSQWPPGPLLAKLRQLTLTDIRRSCVDCKERWPSEAARTYLQICKSLGLVPISYYLRHIDDERLVLRHHSVDSFAAKAIAAPLTVSSSATIGNVIS